MKPFRFLSSSALLVVSACSDSGTVATDPVNTTHATSSNPAAMTVLGRGDFKPVRYTAELFVRGTTAYSTTWGNPASQASVFYIWDVSANIPKVVDSVRVDPATTLGDIAVSDDGSLLVVATERSNGSIVIYSLADPRKPALITRFQTSNTALGVHTAEIGRVNGKLHAFLSIDPSGSIGGQMVIVDLSNPASPQQIYTKVLGAYVHDSFVRDGLLFVANWDDGAAIWDIGGGGKGGTPSAPVELGRVKTINGEVHNIWWLKDPVTGLAKYAFIGEEGSGAVGSSSVGDVHVVDVSDKTAPKEVAFYTVSGAGTHNFSVDEANGILYAAYYNGGVRALDVRGELGTCTADQMSTPAGSSKALCDLRKMGREMGIGLLNQGNPVYVWGVQYLNGAVYASDMINGLWKLGPVARN